MSQNSVVFPSVYYNVVTEKMIHLGIYCLEKKREKSVKIFDYLHRTGDNFLLLVGDDRESCIMLKGRDIKVDNVSSVYEMLEEMGFKEVVEGNFHEETRCMKDVFVKFVWSADDGPALHIYGNSEAKVRAIIALLGFHYQDGIEVDKNVFYKKNLGIGKKIGIIKKMDDTGFEPVAFPMSPERSRQLS